MRSMALVSATCFGLCASSPVHALERVQVENARGLLVAAIDAPDGRAHGVLTGELADAISRRFKTTTPIYIDVTTIRRHSQEGCKRLNVQFWQDGVHLPGAAIPRRQTVDFGIDYCRDGQPPKPLP